jgi:hypothetical protein
VNVNSWVTTPGDLWLVGAGSGSTTIDGSLNVYNLVNAFGVQGFTFNESDTSGGSVFIGTSGDVEMYDVIVDGSTADGGIIIWSNGNVSLNQVESYYSSNDGAYIETVGNLLIQDSTFSDNSYNGLTSYSEGYTTLDGVTANNNMEAGAYLESNSDLLVLNSDFSGNGWRGLRGYSYDGSITLDGLTASGNDYGARVHAYADMLVMNSDFSGNTYYGLLGGSDSGSVTLDGVTADSNGFSGAYVYSNTTVDVFCGSFSDNGDWGIEADTPDLYLNGVTFSGNTTDYENFSGNVTVSDYGCGGAGNGDGGSDAPKALYLVIPQTLEQLPTLGNGLTFGSALKVELTGAGEKAQDLTITLAFPIPDGMQDADLAVMFWNGSAWVEVPGGSVVDGKFVITVTTPGMYVLVSK